MSIVVYGVKVIKNVTRIPVFHPLPTVTCYMLIFEDSCKCYLVFAQKRQELPIVALFWKFSLSIWAFPSFTFRSGLTLMLLVVPSTRDSCGVSAAAAKPT